MKCAADMTDDALIAAAKLQADLNTNLLKFDIPGDKLNPNPKYRKHTYWFARADPANGSKLTWHVRRSPAERDEALSNALAKHPVTNLPVDDAASACFSYLQAREPEAYASLMAADFGPPKTKHARPIVDAFVVARDARVEAAAGAAKTAEPSLLLAGTPLPLCAVPPNIFDDVELPAEEVGAGAGGEAKAEDVTPPTPVPSAPLFHLSPGTVERVADAMAARITPLLERTHSAVRDAHSAVLQGTAEVKSEVKNSAAEVKAEVKAGATEVKALIFRSQDKMAKGLAAIAMRQAQADKQLFEALGLLSEHVVDAVEAGVEATREATVRAGAEAVAATVRAGAEAVAATERVGAVAEKTLTEASGAHAAAVGAGAVATEVLTVTRKVLEMVKQMELRLEALSFDKPTQEAVVGLIVHAPTAREKLSGCDKIIDKCVEVIEGIPSVEETKVADAAEVLRAEAAAEAEVEAEAATAKAEAEAAAKAEADAAAAATRTASLRGGSSGLARAQPNASHIKKIVGKPKASGRGGTKAALTAAVKTIAAPESDFLNASDKQVALRELFTLLPMVPNEHLFELLAPKGYVTLALVCALSYKKSAVVTTAAEVRAHVCPEPRCTRARPLHAPPDLVHSACSVLCLCRSLRSCSACWRAIRRRSCSSKARSAPSCSSACAQRTSLCGARAGSLRPR